MFRQESLALLIYLNGAVTMDDLRKMPLDEFTDLAETVRKQAEKQSNG